MKKLILLIFFSFIFSVSSYCFAETYYMAKTGLNSNDGSSSMPWLTLSYAMSQMSGGDTLIVRNGTYTGTENSITQTRPPAGTPSNYTKIKAENDGGVLFDGENAREMFLVNDAGAAKYWQFEGLIWGRTTGTNVYSNASYIKFIRCGAFDSADGNTMNWGAAANGASYVLFEGCYAWGTGRYKFIAGSSNHIIFRNCVARPDAIYSNGDPRAAFAAYTANYILFQNCIAVDADQTSYWSSAETSTTFFVPTTSGNSTNVTFDRCIGVNSKLGGLNVAVQSDTSNIYFRDTVIWDSGTSDNWLIGLRNPSTIVNCTIGNSKSSANYCDDSGLAVKNSIIVGNTVANSYIWSFTTGDAAEDYNAYYGNNSISIYGQSIGSHSITKVNPLTNSLMYLPRIESGSELANAGASGTKIGATALTLLGSPGTLWGETGYATDTGVSMWPFPNEDLIKTKMATYSNGGVSGARGFCTGKSLDGTSQTLTKYIWEYLGNQIPSEIYAGETGNVAPTVTASADLNSGTVPLDVNFTGSGSDSDGTIASYTWSFGDGGTSTEQSPTHTYISEGNYTATLTVTDNDGGVGTTTVGVVVSATDSTVTGGSTSSEETTSSVEKLINFQPSGSTIPDGYSADTGAVYNSTLGYGWDQDISSQVRDRGINSDQRLDTFVYSDDSVRTWKISLANGQYLVTIVCGDAENARGDHRVLLQGTEIINASTQANQFITVEDRAVTVSDGYLTIQAGGGNPGGDAYGLTNLNYIIIKSVSGTSPEQVQGVVIVK